MKIDAPRREDILSVARAMRARDYDEFIALSFAEDREALAESLAQRYSGQSDTFCAYAGDGEAVAVGAMVQARPGVVTLMFFATDRMGEIGLALTKFIAQRLFPAYTARGVHRIECVSLDGYEEVHRWIEVLGLRREAGPFRGFGRGREAFVQFAWVADESPVGAGA